MVPLPDPISVLTMIIPATTRSLDFGMFIKGLLMHAQPNSQNTARLRVAEIVTWPHISSKTAMGREILSFQRGLIPLLRVRQHIERPC
jgi:hypothetical protein